MIMSYASKQKGAMAKERIGIRRSCVARGLVEEVEFMSGSILQERHVSELEAYDTRTVQLERRRAAGVFFFSVGPLLYQETSRSPMLEGLACIKRGTRNKLRKTVNPGYVLSTVQTSLTPSTRADNGRDYEKVKSFHLSLGFSIADTSGAGR